MLRQLPILANQIKKSTKLKYLQKLGVNYYKVRSRLYLKKIFLFDGLLNKREV